MEFTKIQIIFINAFLSLFVVVLGAYLIKEQHFTATYIICGIGIFSIIGFNIYRARSSKKTDTIHFSDDFEYFDGWIPYRDGNILHSDEQAHNGKFSLKKTGFNDPNGGIKKIKKIRRGFVFSGWIYRPSNGEGGPADRLAIEDAKGNGYGFAIRHEDDSFLLIIEKRIESAFDKNLLAAKVESSFKSLRDIWYCFNFQVTKENKLVLNIDCENQRIGDVQAEDSAFTMFQRIAVHGGYPYYIDSIKIRRI